ncbi:MAG: hypothetical protein FWF29_05740 [Treponema sp.]|nr:hypothetical protein [Treponema sp.]
MKIKNVFERFENDKGFLRETIPSPIDGPQKAALNRKGNFLLNTGDVETARRIFTTTRYSDGLSRVGDYYKSSSRMLDALRMYWIAPDRTKSEPIITQLAELIRKLIQEGEEHLNE